MFQEVQPEANNSTPENNEALVSEPNVKDYKDAGDELFPKQKDLKEVSDKRLIKKLIDGLKREGIKDENGKEVDINLLIDGTCAFKSKNIVDHGSFSQVDEYTVVNKDGEPILKFDKSSGDDVWGSGIDKIKLLK